MILSSNENIKLSDKALNSIIAIGASTGGTEAILQILRELPASLPPIVITQHMPEVFTDLYAKRLDSLCKIEVREAKDGDKLYSGLALIAPGGNCHMKVVPAISGGFAVNLFEAERVTGHRPSVDVLFSSVASTYKSNSIGVILTGMGQDGARGLLEMREKGSFTIGQDKETCVVYGMPKVAFDIGGVAKQAPIEDIADILLAHLKSIK